MISFYFLGGFEREIIDAIRIFIIGDE